MNRTFISIAAAITVLASQASIAGDHSDYSFEQSTARASATGGKTSAEVKAELKDAIAKGQIVYGDHMPAPVLSNPSVLNRVDVHREAVEATKSSNTVYQERG